MLLPSLISAPSSQNCENLHHYLEHDHGGDMMEETYKSMKLSWVEWLGASEQPKSTKLAHDVLP